jgi:putative MATE family efflux protein
VSSEPRGGGTPDHRRAILHLAVPALLTLIAEPVFLLADSAIIGHLGTTELAGLGIAGAALATAAGLFVFLAYGTTAVVSRALGAGSERDAVSAGLDGVWLAAALGLAGGAIAFVAAEPICAAFGPSPPVLAAATIYLRISALGLPAMLLVLATTGILRGLQDTRTPLIVTTAACTGNVVLNLALVYGAGLGIAGSAWGTVIAQSAMALALLVVVGRAGHRLRAPLRPHPRRIARAARDGVPLLVRTLALRGVLLLATWAAAALGDVPLAAYQVTSTIWTFLTFALDALAIAGQALVGRALGAGDVAGARAMTGVMTRWGLLCGAALGVLVLATHTVLPALFTPDPRTAAALAAGLVVIALCQPISGVAFVLDGVLIGAGDARWLAIAQTGLLVAYAPLALAVHHAAPTLAAAGDRVAVATLWAAFVAFMGLRAVLLVRRARSDAWLVTGAR